MWCHITIALGRKLIRRKQTKPLCQALALFSLLTFVISIAQLVSCPLVAAQATSHTSETRHISYLIVIQEQRQPGIASKNIVLSCLET